MLPILIQRVKQQMKSLQSRFIDGVIPHHTIVEAMRRGKSPKDACLEAMDRVVRNYAIDKARLKRFHLLFYALNKDGEHGGASLWGIRPDGSQHHYAVHDGSGAQLVPCAGYFDAMGGDY